MKKNSANEVANFLKMGKNIMNTKFFGFYVFLFCLVTFPVVLHAAPTPFTDAFSVVAGPLGGLSKTYVKNELNTRFGRNCALFSQIEGIDYENSVVDGYNCRIVFSVDGETDLLTVFHYEGNSAEAHYLFNGGCSDCGDSFLLRFPRDIAHYSTVQGALNTHYHYLFVADSGNGRIAKFIYKTHIYDQAGHRFGDEFYENGSITHSDLLRPTGVAVVGTDIFVADQGSGSVFRFDPSGNLLATFAGDNPAIEDFVPYKISAVNIGGRDLVMVYSEHGLKSVTHTSPNLHLLEFSSSGVTVLAEYLIPGVKDLTVSEDLGFLVMANNYGIYQYGFDGVEISYFSYSDLAPEVSFGNSFSADKSYLAFGFDYDSDSGIALFRKDGGVGGVELPSPLVFPKFDPLTFSVDIVKSGRYNCVVYADYGYFNEALWNNEWKGPGTYSIIWDGSDRSEGAHWVAVSDESKSQLYSRYDFQISHGPYVTITHPFPYQQLVDTQAVTLSYHLDFTSSAQIDSTVLYLGPTGGNDERLIMKPGNQDERGDLEFRFTIPEIDEVNCSYRYYLGLRTYYQEGGVTKFSTAWVNPYLIVRCTKTEDPDPHVPCDFPCVYQKSSDGSMVFFNGKKIFVRPIEGGTSIEAYVSNSEYSDLRIYDLRGRLVARREINSMINGIPGKVFSVSELRLPSGVFFARVGQGEEFTVKFGIVK